MSTRDNDLINEAYQQVEEGIYDRLRARGAQAIGTMKGAGQRIAGAAQQAYGRGASAVGSVLDKGAQSLGYQGGGNVLTKYGQAQQQVGAKQVQAGQAASEAAKYDSYIQNAAQGLVTDLQKLNMPVDDSNALLKDIKTVLAKHLRNVNSQGAYIQPGFRGTTVARGIR